MAHLPQHQYRRCFSTCDVVKTKKTAEQRRQLFARNVRSERNKGRKMAVFRRQKSSAMDARAPEQIHPKLKEQARKLHKLSDRLANCVINASQLDCCTFLAHENRLQIDISDNQAYLNLIYSPLRLGSTSSFDVTVRAGKNRSDRLLIVGRYNCVDGRLSFRRTDQPFYDESIVTAGNRSSDQDMFSIGFPREKLVWTEGGVRKRPIGKVKSAGVQIYRINECARSVEFDGLTKDKLEVVAADDPQKILMYVLPNRSIRSRLASAVGLAFWDTSFKCFSASAQLLASMEPAWSIKNRIGFKLKYSSGNRDYLMKSIVLATAGLLLCRIGPIDLQDFQVERS